MTSFTFFKSPVVLAALASAVAAVAASPAVAMPVGGNLAASAGTSLQRVADGHRVYPGSESAAAQKARDERNAPNHFCEKQQQYCE